MRVAAISDVHGNLAALEAVLEAIRPERLDAIWCLGDTVGYGPRPNECCALVEERCSIVLGGNHDFVVAGTLAIDSFSAAAREAAEWTQTVLSDESRTFLTALEPVARVESCALYHGSARDPVWEYILDETSARATLELAQAQVVLVGHSHVALAIGAEQGQLDGGLAPAATELLLRGREAWLLNPGSVGQPRDGDPRAAWLMLDTALGRARFNRVRYPVAETQKEMRAAGLPQSLANRLATGT
jgi:predicted phosphodiesterase